MFTGLRWFLHCGYLHMRGDLMETVVSVFINDIRSVERNFFVWIDAHQEGRDWCLQNLSDLKQYFRLLSQWLRVWLKPNTFCFRSTDLYIMLKTTVLSETLPYSYPTFVMKHTQSHCAMSLWYLHRSGLVWSASTSCPPRPPRSPAPSSSGRSRRARSRWRTEHWAHSNIPILKQKMYFRFISDAKYVSLYFRCKSLESLNFWPAMAEERVVASAWAWFSLLET